MYTVTIDEATHRSLAFAAKMSGVSEGEVVARLVASAVVDRTQPGPARADDPADRASTAAVYADYEGHRTRALFDRRTHRIDITDGPLAGTSHRSPSRAAMVVVEHYKPGVNPSRNGWSFWLVEGSGELLQSLRY